MSVTPACGGPLGNLIQLPTIRFILASLRVPPAHPGWGWYQRLGDPDRFLVVTNIYVGNLPYSTQEDDLVEHFSQWGEVERVTLVFDRETGRPRGFGFVEMIEPAAAQKAIEEAHGENFHGRPLTVNEARPRGTGSRGGNLSVSSQGTSNGYSTPSTGATGSNGYRNSSPPPTPVTCRSSRSS